MSGKLSRWTEPTLESSVDRCRLRRSQGIHCTIAFLKEQPQTDEQASQAARSYLESVRVLNAKNLDASITVKLTTLGAMLDRARCTEHVLSISREAMARNIGFEIATESRDLVEYAVETAVTCAQERQVTLALQAYLDRTSEDLKIALNNGIRTRLVKGAYIGDTEDFAEIQRRLKRLAQVVLENKAPLLFGTHDPELIDWAIGRLGSKKQLVEFGFLKGLADNTKLKLAGEGWKVSEYIPFGNNVEAYESRRRRFLEELKRLGRDSVP